MRMPKARRVVEFRQLYAVAKMVIQQEPSIEDSEWKARVRDHLSKLEFEEPDAAMLVRAMGQVEYAMKQTLGPRLERPVPLPNKQTTEVAPAFKESRTHQPAGWDIVVRLMATLRGNISRPLSQPPPGPKELLTLTEPEILNEFWSSTRDDNADRLSLLRAFAEIAIIRPAEWNPDDVRADAPNHKLNAHACFACRADAVLDWHHIIQIQHGGSNYVRNRVAICDRCHAAIHPWLPPKPRRIKGWSQIAECAPEVLDAIRRKASA